MLKRSQRHPIRAVQRRLGLVLLLPFILGGCEFFEIAAATDRPIWLFDTGGHDPLPPPGANLTASSYQPEKPYGAFSAGVLIRTVAAASHGGQAIEIRDLLVGPNQETAALLLPGAVVFTVLAGQGTMLISGGGDERRVELEAGVSGALAPGQRFSISNRFDAPLDIRLRLFATR